MAFRIASLFAEFRAKGLGRLSASMGVLRTKLAGVSAAMAGAAKAVKIGALAIVASIGVGIWQAVKFEKQMAMVSTMLDEVGMGRMPEFAAGIRRLSVEFGESTETLSKGLYDILSASVAPEKAMDVLATATKAAIGGFTSTAVAADALTTILNSYRMSADQAGLVSDKMFTTVKRGKLTYEELAGSIGKAAATAAIAGVSLDELLASISTITRAGISSDQAMTAVIGTIRSFLKPTDEGAALAKDLGFELNTATLKAEGLSGVFKKLTGITAKQIAILFPNIRGFKGVAAAMQDATGFAKDLSLHINAAGASEEALGKASNTTAHQLNRLKQGVLDVLRTVGDALLPTIRRLADWMTGLAAQFKELVEWIRPVGAALEQLWATMEKVFNVSGLWETVKGAIVTAATAVRDFLVYTVATITTLVARWRVAWETMKMSAELALRTIWEEAKFTFTERIPAAVKWCVESFFTAMKVTWSIAAKTFQAIAEIAALGFKSIANIVKWWVGVFGEAARVVAAITGKLYSSRIEIAVGAFKVLTGLIRRWAEYHVETTMKTLKWLPGAYMSAMKVVGGIVFKVLKSMVENWYNAFLSIIDISKNMGPKIWDIQKRAAGAFFSAIPGMFAKMGNALRRIWNAIWDPRSTTKKISDAVDKAKKDIAPKLPALDIPLFDRDAIKAAMPDFTEEMASLKKIASGFEVPGRVLTEREKDLYKSILDNIKLLTGEIKNKVREAFGPEITPFTPEDVPKFKMWEPPDTKTEAPIKVKAEFDRGSWSGLADVWKNIQSAIMGKDPKLAESKKQTGILTDIRDGIDDLDVGGAATVGAGGT